MAGSCCYNCVYSYCDPQRWLRSLCMDESLVPRCANHPWWPGRMHDVPGTPCRNYRPRPILPEGDTVRLIPLGDGFYAYVDAADYEWLSGSNWHVNNGYASRREKGRRIYMHSEIMKPGRGMVVDHIDGNKMNNCRFNLRVCTPAQNLRNLRKRHGARSRFKGVYYHGPSDKWQAKCESQGRPYALGYFDDESEAARAYDLKAVELYGEFARLNFPEEWPPERRAEVYARRDAEKKESEKVRKSERKNSKSSRATSHRSQAPASKKPKRTTKQQPRKTGKTTKHKKRTGPKSKRQR